ncbi:hypothetical protein F4859DRAFT_333706 [Xylaria cf. heliscus]|nr:hypothetical protein F4859DRAFT_333706 [Xylaria cf. heliscus]
MAPIHDPDEMSDMERVFLRLEDLYKDDVPDEDDHEAMDTTTTHGVQDILSTPNGYDPSITIPKIINYLRDNDVGRDVDWYTNFRLIRGYLADAHRRMVTGSLGFGDSKLRAALVDARVMVRVHLNHERRVFEKTRWTDSILRGQTTQERLLTYPKVFPLPEPDRSKSQYRPMKPMPRPNDHSPVWNMTLKVQPTEESSMLAEVDNYVDSENRFFKSIQEPAGTGKDDKTTWKNRIFAIENEAYEKYMSRGPAGTCANPPPPPNDGSDNPDGTKDPSFYRRRGWQRAALQQCLNLFTSHENRVINTPWRRPILPYDPPAPLPRDVAYVPRVVDPREVKDEKEKDPFSWLHWSSQYGQIVDFFAGSQRRRYDKNSWDDFLAPALPTNFRGPRIYRGLTVHDQHWLKIGDYLEKLEDLIHSAWGAAPRPLLRAILRDIDAGRQENTGGPNMDNSHYLPAEDDDDMQNKKRYWRRDIQRRVGIDSREDNTEDDNFKLIDDFDIAWLRYLCEPSRTLEMCDSSKLPSNNLAIIFDAKLQSFFRHLEVSGYPDSKALSIWGENHDDIDKVKRNYEPSTLRKALAYINGCTDSELIDSGDKDPNPEHPNACYQYSLEEAEFLCVELHNLGRCSYVPEHGHEPARVSRPSYNVHPEDRVRWRYSDLELFHGESEGFLDDMVDHYDNTYGNWSLYFGNRPRFSRELEFMLDHAGPDFHYELERVETQDEAPATSEAFKRRRAFIRDYLAPEGLYRISGLTPDSIEHERDAPYRDDLAPWEAVGAYLTKYHEQHKDKHNHMRYYSPGELYFPQTPERTVQFFRNLAYRAGRTMRYVDQIKERLQYLELRDESVPRKSPLDLSADLREPRPENDSSTGAGPTPVVVEKWWQAISVKDYDSAIEKWNISIRDGSGEVGLYPPDIHEVLQKADPVAYENPFGGAQDPFTVIREGIIENCFQNRPTMYPGRLSGFKDQTDKEFQGYERPSLFEWATKDQRRYQAQHTRRHFFNMQRWPPSRILPHRLEAIRARKDEVARIDPSQPDQAYGILTNRVPIGTEKPLYAHPIIHHGPDPDWLDFGEPFPNIKTDPTLYDLSANLLGADGKVVKDLNPDKNDPDLFDVDDDDNNGNNGNTGNNIYNNFDPDKNDPDLFDVEDIHINMAELDTDFTQDPDLYDVDSDDDTGNTNTNVMGTKGTTPTGPIGSIPTPMSMGTTPTPMGTTPTPMGTTPTPMGTTPTPMGTTQAAMGTTQAPMGTTQAPMGTTQAPMGTTQAPMGTTPAAMGTTPTPMGPTGPTGPTGQTGTKKGGKGGKGVHGGVKKTGLIPFARTNQQFAPGPAVFPMGDTLLQKVLISHELNNALYPDKPFFKNPLLGIPKMWNKILTGNTPLIPLVPPTARSNIPRSNPRKRKMPIEFLNGSATTKKFRSDRSAPLQPGGSGGQFGAATGGGGGSNNAGVAKFKNSVFEGSDLPVSYFLKNAGAITAGMAAAGMATGGMATGGMTTGGMTTGGNTTTQPTPATAPATASATAPPMVSATAPATAQATAPATTQTTAPATAQTTAPTMMPATAQTTAPTTMPATAGTTGGNTMTQTAGGTTTAQPQGTTAFTSLRVYPNPSRRRGRDWFGNQFAGKLWSSSNVDYKFLFSSACQSLARSINSQAAANQALQTTPQALSDLAKTSAGQPLHQYMYTQNNDFFDIHCVAYLLQTFGEQRGAKMQLGVLQEDAEAKVPYLLPVYPQASPRRFAARLVGSQYDKDPEKVVVWIRLVTRTAHTRRLINPYTKLEYNSYESVTVSEDDKPKAPMEKNKKK